MENKDAARARCEEWRWEVAQKGRIIGCLHTNGPFPDSISAIHTGGSPSESQKITNTKVKNLGPRVSRRSKVENDDPWLRVLEQLLRGKITIFLLRNDKDVRRREENSAKSAISPR
jgi:hypothetical protein